MSNRSQRRAAIEERSRRAFTLIELLVVIAVIALLIGILLPSLGAARNAGRAVVCANNTRQVAIAVFAYTVDQRVFPASYLYANTPEGTSWKLEEQFGTDPQNGYIHWSAFLLAGSGTPETAFQCPSVPGKGAPRTNFDVNDPSEAEPDQIRPTTTTAKVTDRQVRRIAISGNDAIFPRNKFYPPPANYNGTQRRNRFVNPSELDSEPGGASRIILATEFAFSPKHGWRTIGTTPAGGDVDTPADEQGQWKSKSHRPITPFIPVAGGDMYVQPPRANPGFRYQSTDDKSIWGPSEMVRTSDLDAGVLVAPGFGGGVNAVGRHHGGPDKEFGSANFVFADGHVEKMSLVDTINKRLWGSKFFSLTGDNRVYDPDRDGKK